MHTHGGGKDDRYVLMEDKYSKKDRCIVMEGERKIGAYSWRRSKEKVLMGQER